MPSLISMMPGYRRCGTQCFFEDRAATTSPRNNARPSKPPAPFLHHLTLAVTNHIMGWEYLDAAFAVFSDVAHGEFPKAWSAVISGNPVALCGGLFIAVIAYCFFGGVITNTHSYVDQLWSILPAAYALVFWYFGGANLRVQVMTAIVTAWAIRLTFNFWRKGA